LATFRGILRDNNFGELWVDGLIPTSYEYLFASVQTINNRIGEFSLTQEYFDYIERTNNEDEYDVKFRKFKSFVKNNLKPL
jgi:hypothetical protein